MNRYRDQGYSDFRSSRSDKGRGKGGYRGDYVNRDDRRPFGPRYGGREEYYDDRIFSVRDSRRRSHERPHMPARRDHDREMPRKGLRSMRNNSADHHRSSGFNVRKGRNVRVGAGHKRKEITTIASLNKSLEGYMGGESVTKRMDKELSDFLAARTEAEPVVEPTPTPTPMEIEN